MGNNQKSKVIIPWSKKSPTGPTERTPQPEHLIALAAYLGVRWKGPIQFLTDMENLETCICFWSLDDFGSFEHSSMWDWFYEDWPRDKNVFIRSVWNVCFCPSCFWLMHQKLLWHYQIIDAHMEMPPKNDDIWQETYLLRSSSLPKVTGWSIFGWRNLYLISFKVLSAEISIRCADRGITVSLLFHATLESFFKIRIHTSAFPLLYP